MCAFSRTDPKHYPEPPGLKLSQVAIQKTICENTFFVRLQAFSLILKGALLIPKGAMSFIILYFISANLFGNLLVNKLNGSEAQSHWLHT